MDTMKNIKIEEELKKNYIEGTEFKCICVHDEGNGKIFKKQGMDERSTRQRHHIC